MITMDFEYPIGAIPLDPGELAGLRLSQISSRVELDGWEQNNILEAELWAFRNKKITADELLSVDFIRQLHERMLCNVWKWAGEFRSSEKSIGVKSWAIGPALNNMIEDVKFWIEQDVYSADEIGARFHHYLVSVHPFVNGNGHHARIMADVLLVQLFQCPRFSWGHGSLVHAGECRNAYIFALRAADERDYAPLLEFVRS
jgi:Fic-DOC domain mobile mystery protein B